jgi:hypothetical protein
MEYSNIAATAQLNNTVNNMAKLVKQLDTFKFVVIKTAAQEQTADVASAQDDWDI